MFYAGGRDAYLLFQPDFCSAQASGKNLQEEMKKTVKAAKT
jgi:hypothetical protein